MLSQMQQTEKKRMIIFVAIAYGVAYAMGLFMWYGNGKGVDLSVFPAAQMLYPAAGVALGMLICGKEGRPLPRGFFVTILATAAIMMLLAIVSAFAPMEPLQLQGTQISVYNLISQYILILGSIAAWILLAAAGREKREAAGLKRQNWRLSALMVAVFLLIYLGRILLSTLAAGVMEGVGLQHTAEWLQIFSNPVIWMSIIMLPVNYFLVFLAFFGEEYGWRYYLQPILQDKFGMRLGVILLGVVWGLWHLPIDLFYYTQTTGAQMVVAQQITCIFLGIFFAYAYLKTQNIWVPVCLHYLNNNLIPIITGNLSADVLENQHINWSDLPLAFLLNGLAFGFFLLTDVFAKRREKA